MTKQPSITEFLALRRNTVLLLVALVFAGTGERLWLGFAPKYLETLGAGVLVIGLFDALQAFLGAVYAYPGGWLTEHWGQRLRTVCPKAESNHCCTNLARNSEQATPWSTVKQFGE